jgi:hypothetical protein
MRKYKFVGIRYCIFIGLLILEMKDFIAHLFVLAHTVDQNVKYTSQ